MPALKETLDSGQSTIGSWNQLDSDAVAAMNRVGDIVKRSDVMAEVHVVEPTPGDWRI